jgi:hypothetical protein
MKKIISKSNWLFTTIVAISFLFATTSQAQVICEQQLGKTTGGSSGGPTAAIGQSVTMNGCPSSVFCAITFSRRIAGTPIKTTLEIHNGQSTNNLKYTQDVTIPGDVGDFKIYLSGGIGTLDFVANNQYTFVFPNTSVQLFAEPNGYAAGQMHINGAFDSGTDLYFILETGGTDCMCHYWIPDDGCNAQFKCETGLFFINECYYAAGANDCNTYYWGLSTGTMKAQPAGGAAPYTYFWYSKSGYIIKNNTSQKARLWYPTGPTWIVVEITDANQCMIKDSVFVNWVDYTCGGIWDYELCDINTATTTCVQGTVAMRNLVCTGNYTFGPCVPKNGASINTPTKLEVSVFPNPSSGMFTYTIANDESKNFNVNVYDLHGRVLYTRIVTNNGDSYTTQELDLGSLSAGIYLLRIEGENTNAVERIIIQ